MMDQVIADYVATTRRSDRLGVELLELHGAHGYLLHNFLSPLTNERTDEYGGSRENRMRFPLEVFKAIRAAWPAHKPLGIRISATDWAEGGWSIEDSIALARELQKLECDYITASSGGAVPEQTIKPVPGYQVHLAERDQAGDRHLHHRRRADHRGEAGRGDPAVGQGRHGRARPPHALQPALAVARGARSSARSSSIPSSTSDRIPRCRVATSCAQRATCEAGEGAMDYQDIIYEERDGTAYVTFNRPDQLNAFRLGTYEEVTDAIRARRLEQGDRRRSCCTARAGRSASAATPATRSRSAPGRGTIGVPVERLHAAIRDVPKPVIAKVRGFAIGGGNVLVTLCDLTIASDNAQFGQVGPKVGSVDPGFGTAYLARIVGEKKAREMWYLCRRYTRGRGAGDGPGQHGRARRRARRRGRRAGAPRSCERSPTAIAIAKRSFNADSENIRGIGQLGFQAVGPLLRHRRVQGGRQRLPREAQAAVPRIPPEPPATPPKRPEPWIST